MSIPLTRPDPDLAAKEAITIPGMAHWAGTGPTGATCGKCEFFTSIAWGVGTTTRCDKYRKMTGLQGAKKLPASTRACKYFEPAPSAAR